jgi:hypothetical protein
MPKSARPVKQVFLLFEYGADSHVSNAMHLSILDSRCRFFVQVCRAGLLLTLPKLELRTDH